MTRSQRRDIPDYDSRPDNHGYQEQLARSLVNCLGHDGAIHACQSNGWDGVLAVLIDKGAAE